MSISRLLAIAVIFVVATVAWFTLGASILARTGEFDGRLSQEVAQLWGGRHQQQAPDVWVNRPRLVTEQVADTVWHALQDDRFLVLPHEEVADYYGFRATDTDGWLEGMRRIQTRLDEAGGA